MKQNKISRAFSPGHITGFFHICDQNPDPLLKGSMGAGFSLAHGVTTLVSSGGSDNTTVITLNGRRTEKAAVSQTVIDLFFARANREPQPLTVDHRLAIPIGAGFGSSGAGALSLAYALNSHFSSPLAKEEAARLAHIAEVQCNTGLGTVIAETVGGLEIRTKAGAPGSGSIETIPLPQDIEVLSLIFGPLSTKNALKHPATKKKINTLGKVLVTRFARERTLNTFLDCSREFAEHTGLLTERVRNILAQCDARGFQCSMPMFGEGVFTLVPQKQSDDMLAIFNNFAAQAVIIKSTISTQGGRVIHVT